jgi:hypothetical protein
LNVGTQTGWNGRPNAWATERPNSM